ncbi:fibronectin type III domain-containing protein [Hymenobacter sp. HSC-4F20]|uniref:fibronectin type III domain-containing protein n=1 Tax=Hymenobacter sp. HSC-4F20 TaxID=2864135 RepID=UPI001C7311A4|nr:fibronectin type III domain-containing protein [Hymenobacter sp. HSC-4F20]MBX0293148.1 fibronectin type III domain-containing protein [Hymenobacter sp. HSC-4F20]
MQAFSSLTRVLTALLVLLSLSSQAQIQLTSADPVTQTFDGLGTSATAPVPTGFQLSSGGSSPAYGAASNTTVTTQAAGTSGSGALNSTSTGGAYNFASGATATSTDRALGYLSSNSYSSPRDLLLAVRNATAQPMTRLLLEYDIEKYRTGTRAFDWQLRLSRTGEANSWSGFVTEGSQTYPADATTGVLATPTSIRKSVELGRLEAGATLYLRWSYVGSGGSTNAQALGLDNLVLTPTLSTAPATPTLTTGTISGSPFCVGSSGAAVTVPFTVSGGLSGPFSAQFSDAAGAFSSDLTQNLIGTGSTSPIAATLPAGTPAGTGYRIRVIHAASGTMGTPNPADLTLITPPASNAVTVDPPADQGLTTTGTGTPLTATATAPSSFVWRYATTSTGPFTTTLPGATAATYTPKGSDFGTAGTYYVVAQATSTCGSVPATSSPVTVIVSAPQPTLTVTPNPVPDFGSVVVGSASSATTLSLSGSNLSGPVTLTPPSGFQLRTGTTAFSCAPLTLTPAGSTLSATVEVRFVPALAQAYAATIAVSSVGASSLPGIQVSGTGTSPVYPPSLSTAPPTALTATTATAGGEVLEDGGSPVTARGVVYATTQAPTTQDDFTLAGSGLGAFTSTLTDLLPNTTYYVRAYATNAQGTSYGPQVSLTTAPVALAAEPTQGSTLAATTVAPTSVTLRISGGNGAKKLLLVTPGPVFSFQPQDGTTYAANVTYGQGDQPAPGTYVVAASAATTVTVTGLTPDTEYTFAVFDYNDDNTSGAENYLLTPYGELTLSTPAPPAGLLLTEDFAYPAGERLTDHGWTAHSVPGTNSIQASATGLSYPSYGLTAGSAAAALTATGEDVHRTFIPQPAGTAVYASVLVNVSSAGTADYFLHLSPDPVVSTFRARLFVRSAAGGRIQFGVSGSGTTTQYDPTSYELNQTYLLLVRYTFGPSGTETRLYVNPGQTEPTTANAISTEAASSAPDNIGAVALRQGANTSPLLLDGLHVANSYAAARAFVAPLPVTLTRLTAQRTAVGEVQVAWTTAQELQARSFRVQRSLDGKTFTMVGSLPAAGTSSQARQYRLLDAAAPAGLLYYRLEQEDQDGTRHQSDIVTVTPRVANGSVAALQVAPNPAVAGQPVQLTLTGRAGQAVEVQVLDEVGRVQYRQPLRPAAQQEQVPLALPPTLPAGTYLLRVSGGGSPPLHTRLVLTR